MDLSDDGSDSEVGAASFEPYDFRSNTDNPTSKSNILKPQIDKIFSEVQKNLPNIDFDSSDVSSDNDEPIFFHQNLKLSSLNAAFDDDKDLDTSLSQGDAPMVGLGMSIRGEEYTVEDNDSAKKASTEEENKTTRVRDEASSASDPYDAAFGSSYDNDLAALMMQVKFPAADDVVSWQQISLQRKEEEEEMYRREEEELQKYMEQHQKNSSVAHQAKTASIGVGPSSSDDDDESNFGTLHTGELDMDEINLQLSSSTQTDSGMPKTNKPSSGFSATEKNFQDRLHQGIIKDLSNLGPLERKQVMREQARTKDQEIVSSLNSDQQTMLNFRLFEELDLDSILSAANESNIPLDSLRVVGRPADSQIPKSHDGGGDRSGAKGGGEELTLMQKLAQLSMVQRGTDVTPATKLDPKTGAHLITPDDSRLIYNQMDVGKAVGKASTTSSGSGPDPLSHTASQTQVFKTSSAGTSTASGVDKAKILYGRLRHEKKESEPPTVFIDLRGFEQKKEEEKQGLQSVQRVLGLHLDQGEEDSSSSDDDEEMVERCNWRQTRQQLKQNLSEHGAVAAAKVLGSSGDRRPGTEKASYTKPPRVINLQEHAASRKWARKSNLEQGVSEETRREHEEAVRRQEEDNKILQEKLEAEKEKTRQREEAKRLREEREKERERRVRMSKQIDAARSTASTLGKQEAGENTPALFDTEVSYEPAPSTLPPNLPPERETLLLTIHLSSNGEIVQHRKRSNRSVDTGSGLSATYTALLSWLLSLVPHDFSYLGGGPGTKKGESTGSTSNSSTTTSATSASSASTSTQPSSTPDLSIVSTINVLGLQQTWQDEELKLNVVVTPSESFLRGVAAGKQGGRSSKGKSDQMKGSSKFGQHLSKFLTVNTLYTVGPWLESLVSVVMKGERPEDKSAAPYLYTPPLPDISTKPLSTFIQSELTRWFGGRVREGAASVDVGIPYTKKEEVRSKKSKKLAPATPTNPSHESTTQACQRPPAALSATCKSDVFLVLSPLLPPSYLGVIMATAQRRGFQVRGVRRIRLSSRLANTLGISSSLQSLFCPGARLEEYQEDRPVDALSPCTVFLLRKENAAHNVPSLIEAFMVQLTLAGLLGCVQMRLEEPLKSEHLFHASTFSDSLLTGLGGELSKSPEFDLCHMRLSSSLSNIPASKRGLEQMTIVILLGHEMLKKCGVITSKLLNVLPFSTKTPVTPMLPERPELLGLKWTPGLTMQQAKELSPYEVGDRRWRASVKQLASEPALVLALRGVDIFSRLRPIIEQQQQQQQHEKSQKRPVKSSGSSQKQCPEVLMSHSASESDIFARLFFLPHELYPDPLARSLLPFLPEARLYFNIVDKEGENGGPPARLFSLKPPEELDLTCEHVLDEVVAGQQPINTLLLVKPQATERYLSRILRKVVQERFRLVGLRMLRLTREEAERLVPASQRIYTPSCSLSVSSSTLPTQNKDLCEQHVEAMTAGPSLVLVLQQPGAVKRLLDLLGPEDPQSARRLSQFLWRGEFGRDVFNNGLYCSSTYIDAVEDIKMLFPDGLACEESELLGMEEIPAPGEDSIVEVCSNLKREAVLAQQHSEPETQVKAQHQITVKEVHEMLLQTTCLVLTPPLVQARFKGKDLPAVDILAMVLKHG
ncbi:nucleoside diphosphate kinase [Elysia marginata]|uniref:Nucleoside diphosphate kinase n=1 Tax=Elysia marginata TaxID=1093978 RepID=A0AAV4G108_9GAST|nr:nucleoside diphosphate kinase [Elysia marginata]